MSLTGADLKLGLYTHTAKVQCDRHEQGMLTSCNLTLLCLEARLPRPRSFARVTLLSAASSPSLSCQDRRFCYQQVVKVKVQVVKVCLYGKATISCIGVQLSRL